MLASYYSGDSRTETNPIFPLCQTNLLSLNFLQ